MTISRRKFEGEQKPAAGNNLEGAPFKPSFGLSGVVDPDFAADICAPHICQQLANMGHPSFLTNNVKGLAFV